MCFGIKVEQNPTSHETIDQRPSALSSVKIKLVDKGPTWRRLVLEQIFLRGKGT